MDFRIVQNAVQNGWETDEWNFDNIDFKDIESYVVFDKLSNELILDIYENTYKSDFMEYIFNNKGRSDDTKIWLLEILEGDWEDLYKIIQEERNVYESTVDDMSQELCGKYLSLMEDNPHYDSDKKWKEYFTKCAMSINDYIYDAMKKDNLGSLTESDAKDFFDQQVSMLSMDILLSEGCRNFFDEYPETDMGMIYAKSYDEKINCFSEMLEANDYDEELIKFYVDHSYGIYEETIDDKMIMAGYRIAEKEYVKEDRRNNRISTDDAKQYIKENDFDVDIQVNSGNIGLEDMSFDHIYINGKLQGETSEMNHGGNVKAWISGRDFGDNRMSKDWFLDTVNEYKK